MPPTETQKPFFHGRGHTLEDILFRGKLGGAQSLEQYLKTRRAMCARLLSTVATSGGDVGQVKEGVEAFDQAIELLEPLRRPLRSRALLDALGPRHLLGLK